MDAAMAGRAHGGPRGLAGLPFSGAPVNDMVGFWQGENSLFLLPSGFFFFFFLPILKFNEIAAMGVIEVNFQTTKKMNRLGSGFDLCTLTKKKDHSLSCSQQRAEENAVNFTFYQPLCSTKPLSSNTVLLSSFFLSSFFRFFPNLTGFFLSVFHLLHFALFSAMRPWMFFPPKNVSCNFKKAAAFWRVFFFKLFAAKAY